MKCLYRASLWPYLGMSSVKDIFKDKFVDHAVPQSLGLSDRHTKTRQTHQLLNAHWQWQGWLVLIVMLVLKSTCKSTMLSICVATIVLLHLCCSLWLLSFSIIVHLCCSFVLWLWLWSWLWLWLWLCSEGDSMVGAARTRQKENKNNNKQGDEKRVHLFASCKCLQIVTPRMGKWKLVFPLILLESSR